MKNNISLNIRYLCEVNKLTQKEFGEIFDLKQNVISTYIKENATPKVETIQQICLYFNIKMDDFINKELNRLQSKQAEEPEINYISNETITLLKEQLADKEKLIRLLEAEISRLKGGEDYTTKTA